MLAAQTKNLIAKVAAKGTEETDDCIIRWGETRQRPIDGGVRVCTEIVCKQCMRTRVIRTTNLVHQTTKRKFRGLCKPCYDKHDGRRREVLRKRIMVSKPAEEKRPDAIIHWHTSKRVGAHWVAMVTCRACSKTRWLQWQCLRKIKKRPTQKLGFSGQCNECRRKRLRGPDHFNWKGGRIFHLGYIWIHCPKESPYYPMANQKNGMISEHRLVAAEKYGRILKRWEHVHHVNNDRQDNRPENLELVNDHDHMLITALETRVRKLEKLLIAAGITPPR